MWFKRKVQSGKQLGRTISAPTLNFHVGGFGDNHKHGVYSSKVRIANKTYTGALYYGPKMHHKNDALEVFVLDFSKNVYGQFVSFKVGKKVRGSMKFSSLAALKKQIAKDLKSIV